MSTSHSRLFNPIGVVLLALVVLPNLVTFVNGQTVLGEAGFYSLTYTVSYQGLAQPGGSIILVNTLSNSYHINRTVTNPRIIAVEIFSPLGNYSVPGPYPIYFNGGDTLLNQTIQIPGGTPLGRYAVTAVAFYQLSYITLQGEVWYTPSPLVVRGSILVTTPFLATVSSILTVLTKYWPPILLIYLSAIVLSTHLVVQRDRKKTQEHRSGSMDKF